MYDCMYEGSKRTLEKQMKNGLAKGLALDEQGFDKNQHYSSIERCCPDE